MTVYEATVAIEIAESDFADYLSNLEEYAFKKEVENRCIKRL
ncbi:MAG: hypothetical protein U9O85_03300 [Euryarchaeota archaeon]|nr:hypothetical protein [Euryarchaeota archaeon]